MLFRYPLIRAVFIVRSDLSPSSCGPRRWLHATRGLRDDVDPRNHYETLDIHPDATHKDIKK